MAEETTTELVATEVPKKPWYRQKTTWAGISTIMGAVAGYATGGIALTPAILTAGFALMGIFGRQGVESAKG